MQLRTNNRKVMYYMQLHLHNVSDKDQFGGLQYGGIGSYEPNF